MNLLQTEVEVKPSQTASPTADPIEVVRPTVEGVAEPPDGVAIPPQEPSLDDPNHPWRRAAGILAIGACRLARARMADQLKTRAGAEARADKVEAGERRGRLQAKRKLSHPARKPRSK